MSQKQRIPFYHSLYFKFLTIFFVVLIFVGVAELYFGAWGYLRLVSRINQAVDWDVAAHLANEIQPALLEEIAPEDFSRLIHRYSAMNMRHDYYLLRESGEIFASTVDSSDPNLSSNKVAVSPIKKALQSELPSLPFYGDDPLRKSRWSGYEDKSVFSVAPIYFNNQSGYLYVVVEGANYARRIKKSGQFFLMQTLTIGGLVIAAGIFVLAFLLFNLLSKRFYQIAKAAKRLLQCYRLTKRRVRQRC